MTDPFAHHPNLRDLIRDPAASFFRDFDPTDLDAMMAKNGVTDWRYEAETREGFRQTAMAGRFDRGLWVFAYGSLCWDPGIYFTQVRRAYLPKYARRLILKDNMGPRGTPETPGLMAALDDGPGCDGLAFHISADTLEDETRRLWARERVAPAYKEAFVQIDLDDGPVEALTFVADHTAAVICPDLSRDQQVRFLASGTGFLGSSLDYARNLQAGLGALGISDPDLDDLLTRAEALAELANSDTPPQ